MDRLDLYHHLLLNEGAYFYKVGIRAITKKYIKEVFSDVLEGGCYNTLTKIVRQSEHVEVGAEAFQARCSLLVFRQTSIPTMFDFDEDDCPKDVKEAKISYLLLR